MQAAYEAHDIVTASVHQRHGWQRDLDSQSSDCRTISKASGLKGFGDGTFADLVTFVEATARVASTMFGRDLR